VETNLSNANLTGTSLYGADLTGADLTGAILTDANLKDLLIDEQAIATLTSASLIKKLSRTLEWIKERKKEQERLAEEARKEAERLAEENRKKAEAARKEAERLAEEQRKLELEKIALNPGFRDLKPGLTQKEILLMNVCSEFLTPDNTTTCYDIDNIKFGGLFSGYVLKVLTIDLGPRSGGGFVQAINEMVDDDPLLNMRGTLSQYEMDYDWSERDRQLFNANEKENLYTVYAKGQVVFRIHENRSYVEYRDPEIAKKFLEENRPKRAKSSDF
jgi:hypothetical protein